MIQSKTMLRNASLRSISLLIGLAITFNLSAQSKKQQEAIANSKDLEKAVFGTKDSATLNRLFASSLSYIHSGGKVESREEALKNISHNKSVYAIDNTPQPYNVKEKGDSMIVIHVFKAVERKADGTEVQLNLEIETVWAKEGGEWKLFRRKATKIH